MEKENNNAFDFLGKILFPQRCRFCNSVIDIRKTACDSCINNLNTIDGDVCYYCGWKKDECKCKNHKYFYDKIIAPYYYEGSAGLAVRKMKFSKVKYIEEPLCKDMADCFNSRYKNYSFDILCYVPMSPKSEKKRGFNQAKVLAEGVSEILGIPVYDVLIKTGQNKTQHNLSKALRSGNVRGCFDVNEKYIDILDNARVLLIDDIKTTGATLNECATTLKINGAIEVFCLTATIAKGKQN